MNRSNFIKKVAGISVLGLLPAIYSWQIEPFCLEFVNIKMLIPNLPKQLEGKVLIQISDIHVGNRFDWQYLIDNFKEAQKLKPDYVVYTGDFVSYENEKQISQLKTVMQHAVKGEIATLAILGNHDYGKNWSENKVADEIVEILNNSDIEVLRNEQKEYGGLNFIGFDDYWGPNFNAHQAMSFYDKTKPTIALCHNPDVCDLDVWKDYKGWILAGHTHGGQCKPPFLNPPLLPVKNKKYSSGKIKLDKKRTLYINRALGHLWQVRFNVRPEITLFEMKKT